MTQFGVSPRFRRGPPATPVVPRERVDPEYRAQLEQERLDLEERRANAARAAASRIWLNKATTRVTTLPAGRGAAGCLTKVDQFRAIIAEVCELYEMTPQSFMEHLKDRKQPWKWARFHVMYRVRTELRLSFPQIGRRLGDLDHTTVRSGIRHHCRRNGLEILQGNA